MAKARWPGLDLGGIINRDFITALYLVIHLVMGGMSTISMCGLAGEEDGNGPKDHRLLSELLVSVPFLFVHSFHEYIWSFYSAGL